MSNTQSGRAIDLGIDLGTSQVKVVAIERDALLASGAAAIPISRPRPQWSEQSPDDWWTATGSAIAQLRQALGTDWSLVRAIGLSGQMHGAVLLDSDHQVLRPAILWNDTRSSEQCRWLEQREPKSRSITGNLAMPGFTAPKLVWVAQNEPALFARVSKVLLPKDWLRWRMTGEFVSEPSDAAGTLWLDVGVRQWSSAMLQATSMTIGQMPRLVEGNQVSGTVAASVSTEWQLPAGVVVAGGAGDNAASAIGVGAIHPGEGFVSLGTSGVVFVVNDRFAPNPADAVHAFCHALPQRWHQMAVTLSAASCLRWLKELLNADSEGQLEALARELGDRQCESAPIFLPYLSGERTPHNDAQASGLFEGLRSNHGRADFAYAVLEGVAFSLADGIAALRRAGTQVDGLTLVGGGSRSRFWGRLIASAADCTLIVRQASEVSAALGAARLGAMARTGHIDEHAGAAPVAEAIQPESPLSARLKPRLARYRALYPAIHCLPRS